MSDPNWGNYVRRLSREVAERGYDSAVLPVLMEPDLVDFGFEEQALRWDLWNGAARTKERRLILHLTHEFSRMLRYRLARMGSPKGTATLEDRVEKIQIFLSHTKHDGGGKALAANVEKWIRENSTLSSFFAPRGIAPGVPFRDVIMHELGRSAVLAFHADAYSSREWCRLEVIEAKRLDLPMVVINAVQDMEERSMPYLGNVPTIRMDPDSADRIELVIEYLLDEVYRSYLWRCRVARFRKGNSHVRFMMRAPELISLADMPSARAAGRRSVVTPGPRLGRAERRLFSAISPRTDILTLEAWSEGRA